MKKLLILLILISVLLISSNAFAIACAQDAKECSDGTFVSRNPDNNCEFNPCPLIKMESSLIVRGSGVALSTTEDLNQNNTKIVVSKTNEKYKGVIKIDSELYQLTSIDEKDSKIKAKLEKNQVEVGNIKITKLDVNTSEIWEGELYLQNELYEVYYKTQLRQMKKEEIQQNVQKYCEENPNASACQKNKEKINCQNTDSNECKSITVELCLNNPTDIRCKAELINYCKDNPDTNTSFCIKTQEKERVNYGLMISEAKKVAQKVNSKIDFNQAIYQTKKEFDKELAMIDKNQIMGKAQNKVQEINNLLNPELKEKIQQTKTKINQWVKNIQDTNNQTIKNVQETSQNIMEQAQKQIQQIQNSIGGDLNE